MENEKLRISYSQVKAGRVSTQGSKKRGVRVLVKLRFTTHDESEGKAQSFMRLKGSALADLTRFQTEADF